MAEAGKSIEVLLCPLCFMKDIDTFLNYDEDGDEYYCVKCSYEGTSAHIKQTYDQFVTLKYKDRFKRHSFRDGK